MKKYVALLILMFLFVFTLSPMTAAYPDNSSLVWIVQPTLEYDTIYYCAMCNLFGDEPSRANGINLEPYHIGSDILNVEKYLPDFSYDGCVGVCVGHGGAVLDYFYDEEKKIFVIWWHGDGGTHLDYCTINDFAEKYTWENRLIPIRKIDSEKIDFENSWNFGYTYHDNKYALMRGDKFIANYIYDEYKSGGIRYRVSGLIDMKLNGKWGLIDKNGTAVTPFMFDDIEFINDDTAFVKYNGKYGVLDVKSTILEFSKSPRTGGGVSVYIFFLFFMSAILILHYLKFSYKKQV